MWLGPATGGNTVERLQVNTRNQGWPGTQRSPEPIPVCLKSVCQLPVSVGFSHRSVLRTNQVQEIQTMSESSQISERLLSCQGQQGDRQLVLAWSGGFSALLLLHK